MPLIAGEGCFVMLDNIEHYEYKTRYGATYKWKIINPFIFEKVEQ